MLYHKTSVATESVLHSYIIFGTAYFVYDFHAVPTGEFFQTVLFSSLPFPLEKQLLSGLSFLDFC